MKSIFFGLLSASVITVYGQINAPLVNNSPPKPGWDLIFSEEFEVETLNTYDKWRRNCGWNPEAPNVDAKDNLTLSNGKLIISADFVMDNFADCHDTDPDPEEMFFIFRTGALSSIPTFTPGTYFEIKCKHPVGEFFHTGIFTYDCQGTNTVPVVQKKECDTFSAETGSSCLWTEVDIWEHPSCDLSKAHDLHTNYHSILSGNNYFFGCAQHDPVSTQLPGFHEAYYTIGAYWETNSIKWYLNNHLVRITTNDIPQEAAVLVLNIAINWPHPNTPQNFSANVNAFLNMLIDPDFDNTMEIEYVRVYQPNCGLTESFNGYGVSQGFNNQYERTRQLADINGDGIKDIVAFGWNYTLVSLGTGTGTFGAPQYVLQNYTKEQSFNSQDVYPRMLADVNGDGKDDIIAFGHGSTTAPGWNYTMVSLSTSNSSVASFTQPQYVLQDYTTAQGFNNQNDRPRMMADVNGDGKKDIVAFGWNYTLVSLSTSTTATPSFSAPQYIFQQYTKEQSYLNQMTRPRFIADVNGDGKDDIVGFGVNSTQVSLSTSTATVASFFSPQNVLQQFTVEQNYADYQQQPRMLADVNGDGKDDIIGFGANSTMASLSTSTSTAAGFSNPVSVLQNFTQAQGWGSFNQFPRIIADVNDDGMADIVGFGSGETKISLSTSTGSNASFDEYQNVIEDFSYVKGWTNQDQYPRFVEDINGDGYNDLVGFGYNKVFSLLCLDPVMSGRPADEVQDSIIDSGDIYDATILADRISIYPNPSKGNININIARETTSSIEIYNNIGQLVYSGITSGENTQVYLSEPGIYFVRVYSAEETSVHKVLIE